MEKKHANLLLPEIQSEGKPQEDWVPKRIPGFRKSSILEIAVFFFLALLFDSIWGTGDRFWFANPHPFWIIIILISTQYGIKEGFIAVIASTTALLVYNLPIRVPGQLEYEYFFYVSKQPLLWSTAVFIIGGLRQRQIRRYNQFIDKYLDSKTRENNIANKYDNLKKVKERIEMRLAGQYVTIYDIFETAKDITTFDPENAIRQSGKLLKQILKPDSFSVFILTDGKLQMQESNWPDDANYKSLFTPDDPLFKEIMIPGKIISVFDKRERIILADEGVLCGSFTDPDTHEIFGIIKIERIEFRHMNREAIARLTIACEWIGYIYSKALAYQKAV